MIEQTKMYMYMDWDSYSIAIADSDTDLYFPVYQVRMRDADSKWLTIAEFRYKKGLQVSLSCVCGQPS